MSTTTDRHRRVSVTDLAGVLTLVLGLVIGLLPPGLAAASHGAGPFGPGDFDIDGNATGASHDWEALGGPFATDGSGNTDGIFKGSMVESTYPNWQFVTQSTPQKSDLLRLYVDSQVAGADSFLWLGAERDADNGSTQVTVEFNQADGATLNLGSQYRVAGDFYLTWNFPGKPKPGDPLDDVTVKVGTWPSGQSSGAYPTEVTLGSSAFRYALGDADGADGAVPSEFTFIELELDLNALFSDGGPLGSCGDFGAVSFRTESSGGGGGGGDESTLKDVAGPFPIDLDTCASVELRKVDEDGNGLSGAEFTAFEGHDSVGGTVAATCTTDATGDCDLGEVEPGDYTLDETVVPAGYRKADGLPLNFTVAPNTPLDLGSFTDPRIPYTIDVEPDGRNAVGNTHEFTVSLDDDLGPVAGADVDLSWSGPPGSSITSISPTGPDASSCTTDSDGECSVVVQSDDAGSGTLTATFDTPYQNTTGSAPGNTTVVDGEPGTAPYSDISDSADKTWVGYVASIEADGTNLRGDTHPFTATVWEVDGAGDPDAVLADGVTVTVSWDGPTGSTIDGTTCVTDGSGTCGFEVDSDANGGSGTVTIVQLDGIIAGIGGQDDEALSDTTPTVATDGSLTAVKTWRIYRASIDDDSVNPAGEKHTFTVTVEYSDDNGDTWSNPGSGVTVDWSGPTPDGQNVLADSTCYEDGTDGNGQCTIVVMSNSPGTGTVTVTGVDGDLVPGGSTTESFDVPDVSATKTWLDFTVDIDGPYVNLVGEPETFTVTVKKSDDGQTYTPVTDGTIVVWNDSTDSRVTGDTCSTGGTDGGECTITVTSDTPGTFDITVTGMDDYVDFDTPADITFTTAATSSKTWVDYRASIEADGVNLIWAEHDFTVTAEYNDGSGWQNVPDDTVVTVTSSGLPGAEVDQTDCADGTTSGACTVTVDSNEAGTLTVTVGSVGNSVAVDSPATSVDVSDGSNLEGGQSASADKTWIAYRADISATATNLTGDDHVFSVAAEQDSGSGWAPVPDGTTVSYSTDNDGTVTGNTCGSTTAGGCTITVDSSSVDEVTVTIDGVSAEDVDGDPTATVANGSLAVTPAGALAATKTWIAVRVDVDADEINVVGESHVFTVDVEIVTPDGTFDAPDGTTVVVTENGVGDITSQTCAVPGTVDGTCTVTVDSSAPGDSTITADDVSFTWDDTAFGPVDLDGTTGVASGQDRTATKTWRDYRVDIEADGLNLVRDDHTFTVTIEQSDGDDSWSAVPDGTTATVTLTGTGAGDAGASTCASTGTVDGDCVVVVTSTSAGTLVATVTAIAVDLPEEQRVDIAVDVTDDSASKTWVAFRGLISPDSVNVTGDSHDFTLTAEYTTNGSDWLAVPDGSEITFTSNGVVGSSVSGDTCDNTVDGDCTVTVTSTQSGDRIVTVTGVDPAAIDVTVGGSDLQEDFGLVDLTDNTATGMQPGTDDDVAATKTWASYVLQLTPAEAVNLLDGSENDPERDHVITAVLTSDDAVNAPVGGQDIAVVLSGDTGTITAVEAGSIDEGDLTATCTTADDGTCDVTITSASPGTATLSGSYQAEVGESDPITVEGNDAVKVWTTFRVTVEADAINVVGNPHTFTVTVEQSNPAGDCDGDWCAEAGVVPTIQVTGTATITDNDCEDNGTGDDGTCTVTITSDTVETVTLTATYEASVGQTTASFSDTGEKTWVDFAIDVDPDVDENLVDTEHVFTVTLTTTIPVEEGTATLPIVDAVPTITLDGIGAIIDNGCADGTDAAGQCTVVTTSGAPGDSTLTASYLGTTSDDAKGKSVSDSGDKLWVDYELVIDPALATNAVGDDHTFTATLTVDTGEGFGPAAGETLQFSVDGVGDVIGGDVDGDLTCTTDEAGECDIVIVSEVGGTTDVGVSYGAEVGDTSATFADEGVKQWVDIDLVKTAVVGDGFDDGDLVEDPGSGLPTLFFTSSDRGPKTAVFEYTITNTGGATLFDVVLTDDRLGTIIEVADGVTLEPGESTTVRAREQFDYDDAAGGLDSIVVNVGVVTASGDDGSEVADTDDAAIQLIAQQSSILLDLQKEVVGGVGDVDSSSGAPTVTWSQDDLAADASKVVRYRLTVTNVGPSKIVDVELTDPMLDSAPLIAVADGVTLEPGESTVVEVDYVLTADEAFPDGPVAGEVPNVATVSGANETRDAFDEDVDDAVVFVQVVLGEVEERQLPATGLTAGGLAPLAMLLLFVGVGLLWLERRRARGR